jgi:hypothetical protein
MFKTLSCAIGLTSGKASFDEQPPLTNTKAQIRPPSTDSLTYSRKTNPLAKPSRLAVRNLSVRHNVKPLSRPCEDVGEHPVRELAHDSSRQNSKLHQQELDQPSDCLDTGFCIAARIRTETPRPNTFACGTMNACEVVGTGSSSRTRHGHFRQPRSPPITPAIYRSTATSQLSPSCAVHIPL